MESHWADRTGSWRGTGRLEKNARGQDESQGRPSWREIFVALRVREREGRDERLRYGEDERSK